MLRLTGVSRSGIRLPFQKIELAICAIFRDEAHYLDEWLDFHIKNGVQKFFLINHRSEDDFKCVLQPWIDKGRVHLLEASSDDQELEYNIVLNRFGAGVKWMAFIDIDEFLFSPTNTNLPTVLKEFKRVSGVFVFWRLFGSSSIPSPVGAQGVLRSFQLCLPPATDVAMSLDQRSSHSKVKGDSIMTGAPVQGKCIVRTSRVSKMGTHWPVHFKGLMSDEKGVLSTTHFPRLKSDHLPSMELLRINHYWSRSLEELRRKSLRGREHRGLLSPVPLRKLSAERSVHWDQHLNVARDNAALENLGTDLPFVFLIGFNKTATRSFHYFFEKNGFPAVHWDEGQLAKAMLINREQGRRILEGYEEFRVFSDFTLATEHQFFEGNSLFRELFHCYPSAYFILNNRNTDHWISSRLKHNSGLFAERHMKARGLDSVGELRKAWEMEKTAHENAVRIFFQGHSRFLELDIDSNDVPEKLSLFLRKEFSYREWRVVLEGFYVPRGNGASSAT